jgi:hypothetical protein
MSEEQPVFVGAESGRWYLRKGVDTCPVTALRRESRHPDPLLCPQVHVVTMVTSTKHTRTTRSPLLSSHGFSSKLVNDSGTSTAWTVSTPRLSVTMNHAMSERTRPGWGRGVRDQPAPPDVWNAQLVIDHAPQALSIRVHQLEARWQGHCCHCSTLGAQDSPPHMIGFEGGFRAPNRAVAGRGQLLHWGAMCRRVKRLAYGTWRPPLTVPAAQVVTSPGRS